MYVVLKRKHISRRCARYIIYHIIGSKHLRNPPGKISIIRCASLSSNKWHNIMPMGRCIDKSGAMVNKEHSDAINLVYSKHLH